MRSSVVAAVLLVLLCSLHQCNTASRPARQRLQCRKCDLSSATQAGAISVVLYSNCDGVVTAAATAIAQAAVSGDVDALALNIAIGFASSNTTAAISTLYSHALSLAAVKDDGFAIGAALATVGAQLDGGGLDKLEFLREFWTVLDSMTAASPSPSCKFFRRAATSFVLAAHEIDAALAQQVAANASVMLPNIRSKCKGLKVLDTSDKPLRATLKAWKGCGKRLSGCARQRLAAASMAVQMTLISNPVCDANHLGIPTTPDFAAVAVAAASKQDACTFANALAMTCANVPATASAVHLALTTPSTTNDYLGAAFATAAYEGSCNLQLFLDLVMQQIKGAVPQLGCRQAQETASSFCQDAESAATETANAQLKLQVQAMCSTMQVC